MEEDLNALLPRGIYCTEVEARGMIEFLWTRTYQFAFTEGPDQGVHRVSVSESGWTALIEQELIDRDQLLVPSQRKCTATISHGPGHQSRAACGELGTHRLHSAYLEVSGHWVYWDTEEGCTGPFGESPIDPE